MATQKKQWRVRYQTWPIRVSMKTHRRVIAWARREHYTNRAAYDILVNRRLDELEEAEVLERPVTIPITLRADVSKITPSEVGTQEVRSNG